MPATPATDGSSGKGKLVVCATPIGNLEDASPRLARTLAAADVVACEDTRQTRKLLSHLGIQARTVSYHQANEPRRAAQLVGEIEAGATVALVSDAGMPGVSDPGHDLIGACLARGITVEAVPGPSAVLTALVVSGLPTDRFCFEGFLPRRSGPRARRLEELAAEPRTIVFFEGPHRALATLDAMIKAFGAQRLCAIARELTKLHEEVLRGPLAEVRDRLALQAQARGEGQGPRGEITLVVGGAPAPEPREASSAELAAEVARQVEGGLPTKEAISAVARATGSPRRVVYQAVLDARAKRC